ncbi:monocarboxylate transporter 13 [Aplysia californica]|uniref:Monocarboxylate transporter 13 n=1 Tax=Aplysia californica TaxID=6500 RepID=A0ABM1W0U4_APLCA|nr:monocarboxylate transporter 13 [Aplysia californica]
MWKRGAWRTREKPPPPLDTGWAWMVVLGVFINAFFMVGIAKSFGLFLDQFKRQFGVSTAAAAMSMSVSAFVYAIGAPTALIVGEMFTPQKVVLCGSVIAFIGMSLSSLTLSMTYVVATFGLCYGIGNSAVYGNGLLMIGKYFRTRRTLATGIAVSGASIGQFVMPVAIEFFLEQYGLGGTLLLISALYFHSSVAGMLFRPIEQYAEEIVAPPSPGAEEVQEGLAAGEGALRDVADAAGVSEAGDDDDDKAGTNHNILSNGTVSVPRECNDVADSCQLIRSGNGTDGSPESREELSKKAIMYASSGSLVAASASIPDVSRTDVSGTDGEPGQAEVSVKRGPSVLARVLDFSVLNSYVTVFYTFLSFFCFFGYFNLILFLPAILGEKGVESYDKAFLISLCGIGDLIARLATGFFGDMKIVARYKIKAMACLLCAINIAFFIYADTYAWLGVHCFLYGLLGGSYVCLLAVVLVDFVGLETMAKNLAVVLLIQGVGGAIGQPLLGIVRDKTESYNAVILVCAVSLAFGGVVLFLYPLVKVREKRRRDRTQSAV